MSEEPPAVGMAVNVSPEGARGQRHEIQVRTWVRTAFCKDRVQRSSDRSLKRSSGGSEQG